MAPSGAALREAKMQRFMSILCRYWTDFRLDEDEEDPTKLKEFQERLAWEKAALKRQGGYEVDGNNIQLVTSPPISTEDAHDDNRRETRRSYNGFCQLHSVGKNHHFVEAVTGFAQKTQTLVHRYAKEFPSKELFLMVQQDHPSYCASLFGFQRSFVELKDCLSSACVSELFEKTLDPPVSCLACRMSLCASSIEIVYVLLHLCQKYPDAGLGQYVFPILRQIHEDSPHISAQSVSDSQRFLLPLETAFQINRIGAITAAAKASRREQLETIRQSSIKGRAKIASPSKVLQSPQSPSTTALQGTAKSSSVKKPSTVADYPAKTTVQSSHSSDTPAADTVSSNPTSR